MPRIKLQSNSYRMAEDILNSYPNLKDEVDNTLLNQDIDLSSLSRYHYNQVLKELFKSNGWQNNPSQLHEPVNPLARLELIKNNIGLEIGFRHSSLIGHNLLKFQLSPPHNSDKINLGIFIVTTVNFQKQIKKIYQHNWTGAMSFERVDRYLRHFKSTIQMPIYLVGIDIA